MKSGDENVLAKCKFFRKMQVTSCKICGRSDGRCRWKKRWFYAVPNVVVGMYSTRESLEKPLYFDPFGQTEFTPLAII